MKPTAFRACSAVSALLAASPAAACIPPAPPLQLSGETDEAYRARAQAHAQVRSDEDKRRFQVTLFDKADIVILARVGTREAFPLDQFTGYAVEASTVTLLKGSDPPGRIRLANKYMTTCGMAGGGSATQAEVGEYIVALHGSFFPSGEIVWHGFRLNDLRDPRLLEGVDKAAQILASSGTNRAPK